ncbi:hypothetical protein CY35_11G050400 [Sphagnum magellanicum]|nr:hypothetical protein CY35_11G050400 [Sphagnum magellanicum]
MAMAYALAQQLVSPSSVSLNNLHCRKLLSTNTSGTGASVTGLAFCSPNSSRPGNSVRAREGRGVSQPGRSVQTLSVCTKVLEQIVKKTTWQKSETRIRAQDEDFEVEDALDYDIDLPDDEEEDEGDQRDYETDYDMPVGEYPVQESETFMSTEGVEEERVVDYKIDEEEFHKLSLYDCDFFIRKVPDPDNDVYDFREPLRCMKSNYYYVEVTEPPVDTPRAPLSKTEYLSMKVFLIKHLRNVKTADDDFILDFEEIYVIDSATKSIKRADVKVEVETGKNRDRTAETLIVRDDGNTFRLIPSELKSTPDEVIGEVQWERTRENMENYLRGFRDYEKSNWF